MCFFSFKVRPKNRKLSAQGRFSKYRNEQKEAESDRIVPSACNFAIAGINRDKKNFSTFCESILS